MPIQSALKAGAVSVLALSCTLFAQSPPALPRTPLPQAVLDLVADEVSGQMAFNNLVRLAGAPWQRSPDELTGTFYETRVMADLVRAYGIETTRIERSPRDQKADYPTAGELWVTAPDKRLVARLGADAALVAGGSSTADITAELAYLPPERRHPKLRVLSSAPIFADAIRRNYLRQSIGHLVACGDGEDA